MRRLLSFLLIGLVALPLEATTRYVRVAGDDTFCDGLTDADCVGVACVSSPPPDCAEATITAAWAAAACGDTIHVDEGTYSTTTTTAICGSSSTIFAALTTKSCAGNHIVIEGEVSAASDVLVDPNAFDASRLSIFDGNDTVVRAVALDRVIGVTIKDIAFREIKGGGAASGGDQDDLGFFACDGSGGATNPSREITLTGTLIHGVATAASSIDAGFILLGANSTNGGNPSGSITNNHFLTDWQYTLSLQGAAGSAGSHPGGTDSNGLLIDGNLIERAASWGSASGVTNRRIVDMRHLRNFTFSNNVVNSRICSGRGAGSGQAQHLFAREMNDTTGSGYIRIFGNVFSGVGGGQASGNSYGVYWQDQIDSVSTCDTSNGCYEKVELYNNLAYMDCDNDDAGKASFAFAGNACNGSKAYNNAVINLIAGDAAASDGLVNSFCDPNVPVYADDGLTDNWFWKWSGTAGEGNGMRSPTTGWLCDTGACADCRNGDLICTDADVDSSGGNCIAGGTTPYYDRLGNVNARTFFAPAAPCTDAGDDSHCALSPGTDCDIGAFGSTTAAASTPQVIIMTNTRASLDVSEFLVISPTPPTCASWVMSDQTVWTPDSSVCEPHGELTLSGYLFTLRTPPVGKVAVATWGP